MLMCGRRYALVALASLASAILLFSCGKSDAVDTSGDENLMTEYSENLTLVMSQNGRRSYLFETPLVEGYTMAREPYREFRKGIKITTYKDDSLSTVDAILTANYAIYYENRELWEAKGNVVARKPAEGKTLYTQQLFWNARTRRVYSNVDSKMVENEGRNVYFGESFESDEEFKDWKLRRSNVRMEVEMKINEADTVKREDSAATKGRRVQSPPQTQQRSAATGTSARKASSSNTMQRAGRNRPSVPRQQPPKRPETGQSRPAPVQQRKAETMKRSARTVVPVTSANDSERGIPAAQDPKTAR